MDNRRTANGTIFISGELLTGKEALKTGANLDALERIELSQRKLITLKRCAVGRGANTGEDTAGELRDGVPFDPPANLNAPDCGHRGGTEKLFVLTWVWDILYSTGDADKDKDRRQ